MGEVQKSKAEDNPASTQREAGHRALQGLITQTLPPDSERPARMQETSADGSSGLSRLLMSPKAVTALVPLLVLSLGITLTLVGQLALSTTSRSMAQERFSSHTDAVRLRLATTLAQAEPVLNELTRIARVAESSANPEALVPESLAATALELRDLTVGRPGLTQAYIGFASGRFLSVDPVREATTFQVTENGRTQSFRIEGQSLVREGSRESEYDPRVRDWFKQAAAEKVRVWSSPYPFFLSGHTGVTRAHPIYLDSAKKKLLAVVGVDFDVDTLTAFMAAGESSDDKISSVAFTRHGVVLAYPDGAAKLAALDKDPVPTHEALQDPALSKLVSLTAATPLRSERQLLKYSAEGEKMLASIRTLGDEGPPWFVATFAAEKDVLAELHTHRQSSLGIGLFALLCASIFGWFLGKHLLTARQVIVAARIQAEQAHEQIRLLGSYRLEELLGEGGMGEVWRASHQLLAREAAIKLIKRNTSGDTEQQRERFRREAQAIAGLRSRHTVDLYDYGITPDGTLFYVMELLIGIDLHTLVRKHGPQPAGRVLDILIQASSSLSEAHERGLVHRDIKPANLFLCREAADVDVVKVLDFGLVFHTKSEDEGETSAVASPLAPPSDRPKKGEVPLDDDPRITHADHQLGTPAFMSPEQALGAETDGRSDLYALACVAWWLLTGAPLFQAETSFGIMHKHVEEPIPRLTDLCPSVPAALAHIIESCLAKSPLDRPQSAEELGALLRKAGPTGDDWSAEAAQKWWKEHIPSDAPKGRRREARPLHNREVLGPEAGGGLGDETEKAPTTR